MTGVDVRAVRPADDDKCPWGVLLSFISQGVHYDGQMCDIFGCPCEKSRLAPGFFPIGARRRLMLIVWRRHMGISNQ